MPIERYKEFTPTISPTAYVHPMATVIGDVEIADEATVWPGAVLRGDDAPIRIGPLTSIQDGTIVHTTKDLSETHVGAKVTVGHGVILHGCIVEDECLIGMGATVLDNAVIGTGSLVGACALVTPNTKIPPHSLVLGVPGKVIRPLNEKERAMIDNGWKEYQERGAEYRERDAT